MKLYLAAIITCKHSMALSMVNESVVIKHIPQTVKLLRMACKHMFPAIIKAGGVYIG